MVTGIELLVSLVMITLLFALIFKVLPDVALDWRDVWYGAIVTALLFTVGRTLIAIYLTYTAPDSTYGAAGSLVLTLLWVYYSSLILFFGAALTKAHLLAQNREVEPTALAVRMKEVVVEEDEKRGGSKATTLQEHQPSADTTLRESR
jgi:membrane protein